MRGRRVRHALPRRFRTLGFWLPLLLVTYFFYWILPSSHSDVPERTPHSIYDDTGRVSSTIRQKWFKRKQKHDDRGQSQPATSTSEHYYHTNGLLEVNPNGPHPIYELIANAERAWKEKHERQSKTLEEAVAEYKRRYKRAPPKGFDTWWEFTQTYQVPLPDEYDQIYLDLEPFWGIEPSELHKSMRAVEGQDNSYTLVLNNTKELHVVSCPLPEDECDKHSDMILDLLEPLANLSLLPEFRITISIDDRPSRVSDYGVKSAVLQAAYYKTYATEAQLPRLPGISSWRYSCPPNSPARRTEVNPREDPGPPTTKTFIHDHVLSMDPCYHTTHFQIHGQYSAHFEGPEGEQTFMPQFAHCSSPLHHDIRMPTPYEWYEDVEREYDPPFSEKADERLLWRGRNTGILHAPDTLWKNMHRNYLMRMANEMEGTLEVLRANVSASEPVGEPMSVRRARVNPAMMDVAYAEGPINCEDGVCEELLSLFPFRPFLDQTKAGKYKYVFDVDGNGWSGRFKKLMTTNALVFKSTIYPEWYHDRVQPWVHYVPIQVDLSDLHDALIFFRGDGAEGVGNHEDLAEKIAHAGREWSLKYWRMEDLAAYFFRLLLEYARLASTDREAMSFELTKKKGRW